MAKPATTSHLQEQSHLSPVLQVMHWQLKPQLCPTAAWQTWSPVFVQTLPISPAFGVYLTSKFLLQKPRGAIKVFGLHLWSPTRPVERSRTVDSIATFPLGKFVR